MEHASERPTSGSGKSSKGSSSRKKKKGHDKPSPAELEELKRRGRRLRSSKKEGGLHVLNEGLTREYLEHQPTEVGLVYDERMLEYKCMWDNHPECPERISRVYERCKSYGLTERCVIIPAKEASEDELLLCHTSDYIHRVEASASMSEEQLKDLSSQFDGIYFHSKTWEAAKLSLGSSIDLVERVWHEELRSGVGILRPPGHHAMKSEACGYCFFNNVASAAKHAIDNLGAKRVMILDWDVHHGNGTQDMFYDDPRVLCFSIHRYEHGLFWPNLESGRHNAIGKGQGKGYNINVPVNQAGMTNGDYMAIMQQIVMPIAYEFSPELILVSAGYDSAVGCPEGEMEVTPAMYAHFINQLKPLANGKLCVIQEGGYCLKSLAEGMALTVRALLGDPVPDVGPLDAPCDSMVASILKCITVLRPYWDNLTFQGEAEEMPAIVNNQPAPINVEFSTPENQPEKHDIVGDFIVHSPEKAAELDKEIDSIITATKLNNPPNRTCLVYDKVMRDHKSVSRPGHPERPDRITRIYEKHKECGLLDRCKRLESRYASKSEITVLHGPAYFDTVESYKKMDQRKLTDVEETYNSIFINPDSFDCARVAVGCTLNVVDEVCSGQSQNGVCIVRPPGHHAEMHSAMGFCFFNTAAIAAKYAQQKHGAKRVLILDWDVHHGNGTQHMFYEDPSVLYVSLHRYDNGWFFPSGEDGDFYMVGEGKGRGYNINIPWNSCDTGDAEYIAAFQQIVMPVAYEFCPDLVIVSAGFDAARGDPLGGLHLSPEGYGNMTQMLLGLAGGKLVMVLEGGYNLNSISESMAMCTSVMLGDVVPVITNTIPSPHAVDSIRRVLSVHQHHWKCLRFYIDLPVNRMEKREEGTTPIKTKKSELEDFVYIPSAENPHIDYHRLLTGSYDSSLKQIELETSTRMTLCFGDTMKLSNVQISGKQHKEVAEAVEKVKCVIYQAGGGDADTQVKDEVDDLSTSIGSMRVSEDLGNSFDTSENYARKEDSSQPSEDQCEEAATSSVGAVGGASSNRALEVVGNGVLETSGIIDQEARQYLGKAAEGMENLQMHAVVPLSWCRHLEFSEQMLNTVPEDGLNHLDPCLGCGNIGENWVCLNCYEVHCSRYVNEHMLFHGIETGHKLVLSYADLSVWCYGCDNYVHNQMLFQHKRAAHLSKFNEDIPNH